MQFSGSPRNISKQFSAVLGKQMVVQLTQLGLHFMHYYYQLINTK